ncbi:hypothetical protein M426DRAFT_236804 [Hypoxylon sp. CI-4A]|nr:hypothetical protein M426DRAFT_236804 [Hypoxylon sp. CI-4A]
MKGAGSTTSYQPPPAILKTFRHKLAKEWKSRAYSGREYYHGTEIVNWMLRTDMNKPATNAGLLLTEVYLQKSYDLQYNPSKISNEENRCLVVFALLLELEYGHLIDVFQRYDIIDKKLPKRDMSENKADFQKAGVQVPADFWIRFEELMWQYFPCPLKLEMSSVFLDPNHGRWVMPFCKRQRVNEKGGTAQVWEVAVQEAHVPRRLAKAVSSYQDHVYGLCYMFAVKTFTEEYREVFEWEKNAYHMMRKKSKPGMIQFLGDYEIDEKLDDGNIAHTWNIILEFGDDDLEEFFASSRIYPPNLFPETIQFYNSLANIAEGLDLIHDLDLERENGLHDRYSGWHCDLKPDNILRVDGEFKLADFGFAKFQRRNPGNIPRGFVTGGTETYGAPECDRARRDPSISVTQTIDTWSFGCVLSVSATWVVLGYQGVRAYTRLRQLAIRKLHDRKEKGENVTIPAADDAFHNGRNVLPEVKDWHNYLRKVSRGSDTVTGPILDLVDEKMLLIAPDRQPPSEPLYDAIQYRLQDAQAHYEQLVKDGVLEPVAESVKEALLSVESQASAPPSPQTSNTTNGVKESSSVPSGSFLGVSQHQRKYSRINKSKKMEKVIPGKVAHRQEAMTEQKRSVKPDHEGLFREPSYGMKVQSPRDTKVSDAYNPISRSSLSRRQPDGPFTHTEAPIITTEKEVLAVVTSDLPTAHPHESPSYERFTSPPRPPLEQPQTPNRIVQTRQSWSQYPIPLRPTSISTFYSNDQSGIDPSWPVYQEHEAQKVKGKGLKGIFFRKKGDDYLKNFLVDRDIVSYHAIGFMSRTLMGADVSCG